MQSGSTRSTAASSSVANHSAEKVDATPRDFAEEREALRRVLENPEISRSTSLLRFLQFVCNKYFDGQTDDIREYSIAVEALGRRESEFDSRVDPIVRVTARALRKKLGAYYENEGRNDPIRIVLPLGHYVPQFVSAPDAQGSAAASASQQEEGEESADSAPHVAATATLNRRKIFSVAWKVALLVAVVGAAFAVGFLQGRRTDSSAPIAKAPIQWGDPVWSDEFDGTAQQVPDPSRWTFDIGGGGWGNKEEQTYCSSSGGGPKPCNPRHPNAFLDGAGHLVLRAQREPDGVWTSARITSRGLKTVQYGRIEARIKMPVGKGLWPTFWMLGSDFPQVGWPAAGSFSLVENVALNSGSNGLGPSMIRSTVHGPHYYGANGIWHNFHLPNGERVDDGNFHTYGVIWSPGMLQFYLDDPANVYFVANSSSIPEGGQWVFDHPFYFLMNLAIGGDWPGSPDSTTPNPADLLVDYVRIYRIPPVPAPSMQWTPVDVRAGSTAASNVQLKSNGYAGRVYLTCSTEPATAVCSVATPIVNFSDTLTQQDTLTITTDSFTASGRVVAPVGQYKLTLTATTISGDRSQLVVPFDVKESK
jgi:beta-glucanase (GH16 family)